MPAPSEPEGETPTPAASSAAPAPAGPTDQPGPTDLGRRTFFRRFAGELVQTAASLTGAATVAQSAVAGAAAAAQELAGPPPIAPATPRAAAAPTMEQLARRHLADGIAPWSWDGERLLLIDQRRLPGVTAAFPVGSAAEAARAVGDRVVSGPSAAIAAVWGLVLSAAAAAGHPEHLRSILVAGGEQSVLAADPGSHVLRATVRAWHAAVEGGAAPRKAATQLEAAMTADHADLGDRLADALSDLGIVAPLLHGPGGAIWGAGAGVTLDGLLLVRPPDAPPVTLTEGRPWLDGARVTAWELAQRGVPARILLDAAAPAAVVSGGVDGVLCAAERVAADGSVSVPVGGLALALAAARAGVPFIVAAAPWSIDPDAADATALREPPLAAAVVARLWGSAVVPASATVEAARAEVVPADLVSRLVRLR